MMSNAGLVDVEYDNIVREMASQHRNIEPYLLIKSAMLRKKYPSEIGHQHFWLELFYREGVDPTEKTNKVFTEVGRLPSYHGHGHFLLDIQADLETLLMIASDSDIERISGEVYPL